MGVLSLFHTFGKVVRPIALLALTLWLAGRLQVWFSDGSAMLAGLPEDGTRLGARTAVAIAAVLVLALWFGSDQLRKSLGFITCTLLIRSGIDIFLRIGVWKLLTSSAPSPGCPPDYTGMWTLHMTYLLVDPRRKMKILDAVQKLDHPASPVAKEALTFLEVVEDEQQLVHTPASVPAMSVASQALPDSAGKVSARAA